MDYLLEQIENLTEATKKTPKVETLKDFREFRSNNKKGYAKFRGEKLKQGEKAFKAITKAINKNDYKSYFRVHTFQDKVNNATVAIMDGKTVKKVTAKKIHDIFKEIKTALEKSDAGKYFTLHRSNDSDELRIYINYSDGSIDWKKYK